MNLRSVPANRRLLFGALLFISASPACAQPLDTLQKGFASPPESTKPRCYWYWMDGRVTKEGITRDLEAMKRVGIGAGYIGIIGGQAGEPGNGTKALTEPWWRLLSHAVREGGRLGVDIGLFNSPGWSQSGGPWVKPNQTMRHVVTREVRLRGPQRFEGTLAMPEGAVQDIATLAFPAPQGEGDTIARHSPKIGGAEATARLFDGDIATSAPIPAAQNGEKPSITLEVAAPFTARSLVFHPSKQIRISGELQVSDDGTTFKGVRTFAIDRHNLSTNVGPVPLAPISVAFPAVTGRFFRLVFSGGGELGEITLSAAARVENYAEKQLSKVFQDPQPPFDAYVWPSQAEPEAAFAVPGGAVQNISAKVNGEKLTWDVPPGDWIVLRTAMAPTGVRNSPAPPEATGLEVDKMNRAALREHFDAYAGELIKRMPAAERKALKYIVGDSYETGPQNWTDDFAPDFKARYGYEATPFLPVLSGRIVGSAEQSNRFLWDLRRHIADRVARDYVGGLRDLSRQHGLKLWLENYGHWGFPGEFLQYGGYSDEIGGEFWADGNLGSVELRDAASAAHIYGMPVTYAEAFTGGPLYSSTPWSIKRRGDWAFCQGINQFVLHVYIAQPDEKRPGVSAWFGTEFNRHNTWFNESKSWMDYLRRCHFMLQQGKYVADVAYFIGEDAPKMTGLQQPELPAGYSFDYINADVIEKRLQVKNGRFVLPDGMSYRLIVLPHGASIRPELLKKLRDLVAQGGAVYGQPPAKSPSLQNYPVADTEIRRIASQMWAKCDGVNTTSATFGKGRVFRGATLENALKQLNTPPDLSGVDPAKLLFIHRRTADGDVYFLSNQTDGELAVTPSFRVSGRAPELWNADTGQRQALAVYAAAAGQTRVPLRLGARESAFVVFRGKAAPSPIMKVLRDGKTVIETAPQAVAAPNVVANPGTFTLSLWAKPSGETVLLPEAKEGVKGLGDARNDVIFPPHGDSFSKEGKHSGAGLAVGTNGVSVFEHGASYFVPILMHAAPLSGWNHIAIVYRDGQPSLYLNGVLARTGLKSDYIVHPGAPGTAFRGSIAAFEQVPRALSPAEIAARMKATLPGASSGAPLQLTLAAKGEVRALAWQSGRYALQRAGGKTQVLVVPPLPASQELTGAWPVSFPAGSGAPAQTVFESLSSLSMHSDPTIKYFSGTATYSRRFEVPADALKTGRKLFLDLGEVHSLAEVTLNGTSLGTLWQAPFVVDISGAANPGTNDLQVRVTNAWHNRLVGQKRAPEAFMAPGVEQPWASVIPNYGPNEPLFPAGLLGPVTLRQAAVVWVR